LRNELGNILSAKAAFTDSLVVVEALISSEGESLGGEELVIAAGAVESSSAVQSGIGCDALALAELSVGGIGRTDLSGDLAVLDNLGHTALIGCVSSHGGGQALAGIDLEH
jgi:hypothetical protein